MLTFRFAVPSRGLHFRHNRAHKNTSAKIWPLGHKQSQQAFIPPFQSYERYNSSSLTAKWLLIIKKDHRGSCLGKQAEWVKKYIQIRCKKWTTDRGGDSTTVLILQLDSLPTQSSRQFSPQPSQLVQEASRAEKVERYDDVSHCDLFPSQVTNKATGERSTTRAH